ncbi:MAG TPA: hypothetical protein VES42_21695 [Pilimelia sp.]|nr:hypothetical protein [Pilimelia sp.]
MSPVKTAPARLTVADAALRAEYLTEVLGLLYPGASVSTGGPGPDDGPPVAEYLVVPDARRPRLLVPADSRRVAAAAVRRYAEPSSRLARLKRDAVVAALRTGASAVLLRDRVRLTGGTGDTIDAYLREVLGRQLSLSVHIGPARANRKPVLQLLTVEGATVAFAKLGTGPLTRRLVRAEATALTTLGKAGLRRVTVPRVMHAGQWLGHEVLVQSALPVWHPRAPLGPHRLTLAMRELATSCGVRQGPLGASPYAAELRARLAAVAEPDPAAGPPVAPGEGPELAAAGTALLDRRADATLRYGAWHGDWAPWNMASLAESVLVWDWERFGTGVPLGFDAVHYELQRRIEDGQEASAAVTSTIARAPELLAGFDVAPDACELTALLYLVDLAARYLADRQAEAGARLGVLGRWLLPVLVGRVAAL